MTEKIRTAFLCLGLLCLPQAAAALSCSGNVTNINFGSISVRSGTINQTSGTLTVNCSDAVVGLVGVCVEFGAGSGGAANMSMSPRYMRDGSAGPLEYELRPNGNGAGNGTLQQIFLNLPIVLGSGSTTIPIYADIVDNGVGLSTGAYSSLFTSGDVSMTYGVANCGILGSTGTVSGFSVSGLVSSSCEANVTALNFGTLPSTISSLVDAEAVLNVQCTNATNFAIRLGLGNGAGVTDPTQRRMTNGASTLTYGVYQNAGRTIPWGNNPTNDVAGTGIGLNQSFGVFGRVNSSQAAVPGLYTDNVVITIDY